MKKVNTTENLAFERDDLLGKNAYRNANKSNDNLHFGRKREEDLDDCL